MILNWIIGKMYTGKELEYLIGQKEPLEILYNLLSQYIIKGKFCYNINNKLTRRGVIKLRIKYKGKLPMSPY